MVSTKARLFLSETKKIMEEVGVYQSPVNIVMVHKMESLVPGLFIQLPKLCGDNRKDLYVSDDYLY